MSQDAKFNALIKKAQANGWKWDEYYDGGYPYYPLWQHSFARALFGEEEDGTEFVAGIYGEQPKYRWKYHLQQAVISKDQVDYMYEAVFDVWTDEGALRVWTDAP